MTDVAADVVVGRDGVSANDVISGLDVHAGDVVCDIGTAVGAQADEISHDNVAGRAATDRDSTDATAGDTRGSAIARAPRSCLVCVRSSITIPLPAFGAGESPSAVVPMRFPAITFWPWPALIAMPAFPKRCTTKPRTDVLLLVMARPAEVVPALVPSRTTQLPWVVASMVTASAIAGSADVSWMVCTPGPGMAKVMLSAPAAAFAAVIASRRLHVPSHVPSPGSFVVTPRTPTRACGGTRAASIGYGR